MHEVLVIAGEKSAEEHFLSFCSDLKETAGEIHFFGVGGKNMKSQGVELIYDLESFSSMGFTEPIKKLPYYIKAMMRLLHEAEIRKVQHAILVDFQEFNLKIAERLTKRGIKVLYYVAPQAWIWREGRTKKLSKFTNYLFTILPFEESWFRKRGVRNIISCRHPVYDNFLSESIDFDAVEIKRKKNPTILFLPGSRNSEVQKLLPIFYRVCQNLRKLSVEFEFSIVISNSISISIDEGKLDIFNKVYTNEELNKALYEASFSVAASGTVNLSCAFFKVPTVVCYDANKFNFFVAQELIGYKGFVSLVNIIMNHKVFPELLNDRCKAHNILNELLRIIKSKKRQQEIKNELSLLRDVFDKGEAAPGKIIGQMIKYDKKREHID